MQNPPGNGNSRKGNGKPPRINKPGKRLISRTLPPPLVSAVDDGTLKEGMTVNANVHSFRIGKLLGEGGMGAVHEAINLDTGDRTAIKFVLQNILRGMKKEDMEANLNRFIREALLAVKLRHPNLMNTLDFGFEHGNPFIVMEYFPGQNLHGIINRSIDRNGRSTISWKWLGPVMMAACQGIQAAHNKQIMHRDIKPGNIMVMMRPGDGLFRSIEKIVIDDEPGRPKEYLKVKVLDFGLAKHVYHQGTAEELTRHGQIAGTPEYMAPEQISKAHQSNQSIDTRVDVYALGAVMYRAMVGQPAFPTPTEPGMIYQELLRRLNEMPVAPRRLRPDIPLEAEKIIMKAMATDSKDRYPTALALGKAIADSLGYATPQPSPTQVTLADVAPALQREKPKKSWIGKAIATVTVAAVVGGGVYLAYNNWHTITHKAGQLFSKEEKKSRSVPEKMKDSGPVESKGYVAKIVSTPSGMDVVRIVTERRMVKGMMRDVEKEINLGKTPLQTVLPPGTHTLKVMKRGRYPIKIKVSESKPNCEVSFYSRQVTCK